MLCRNLEDWLLKNHQNLACKILNVQLYNGVSRSVFNGFISESKLRNALFKMKEILKIKKKDVSSTVDQTPILFWYIG